MNKKLGPRIRIAQETSPHATTDITTRLSRLDHNLQINSFIHSLSTFSPFRSAEDCEGDDCASECSGKWCGSTLPVPPVLRHASQPCLSAHLHDDRFIIFSSPPLFLFPLLFRVLQRRELRQRVLRVLVRQYVTRTILISPSKPSPVCLLALHSNFISFSSANGCFNSSSPPFFFHPILQLQGNAQDITAPTSARGIDAAVRYPCHSYFEHASRLCCSHFRQLRFISTH